MFPLLAVLSGRVSPSDASLVIPVTPGSEPIVDFRREISRGWITKLVLQRDSAGSWLVSCHLPTVSFPLRSSRHIFCPVSLSHWKSQISVHHTSYGFPSYRLQLHFLLVKAVSHTESPCWRYPDRLTASTKHVGAMIAVSNQVLPSCTCISEI
jgi:hypothetical protein